MKEIVMLDKPAILLEGLHHELINKNTQSGDKYTVEVDKLSIPLGGFVSILGGSGCGKTTLLTILGLARMPRRVDGKQAIRKFCLYEYKEQSKEPLIHNLITLWKSKRRKIEELRRRTIGFCLQDGELLSNLTALENIEMPLLLNNCSHEFTRKRAKEVFSILSDKKFDPGKLPIQLSGGQKQRIALARSIVHSPNITFVDEPTGSLDQKTAETALDLLAKMQKEEKMTVVMITHDENLAKKYSDYIVRLHSPRERFGTIEKFERKFENTWLVTDVNWNRNVDKVMFK
ncbi:MAG: ATP-binding cassette domain-containing protein [Colwellia sp.]|nr:ATP-binding cassette domain-containing protein [Colwellia sp.]